MRLAFVRLLFAYLAAAPVAAAGLVLCFFIGTFLAGVPLLFLAGLIVAWGWMPFIPSGRQLHENQRHAYQDSWAESQDKKEGPYECEDRLDPH